MPEALPRVSYDMPLVGCGSRVKHCIGDLCNGIQTEIPHRDDYCARCMAYHIKKELGLKVEEPPRGILIGGNSEDEPTPAKTRAELKCRPGDRFGLWTVQEEYPSKVHKVANPRVQCQCDCGTNRLVLWASLRNGYSRSCGCVKPNKPAPQVPKGPEPGDRFGQLTFVRVVNSNSWELRCDCGKTRIARACYIENGRTTDCGCGNRKRVQAVLRARRHGTDPGTREEQQARKMADRAALKVGDRIWYRGQLCEILKISSCGKNLYTEPGARGHVLRRVARPEAWGPSTQVGGARGRLD